MKTYKTRKLITKHLDKIFCDHCNEPIEIGLFDVFKAEVKVITGTSFPEGRITETITIDLCQDCAENLLNDLESNGYNLNKKEE